MIAVRCQYCGASFSIEEWQSHNFCCSSCDVAHYERRQCPTCRSIFTVERRSKDQFCPTCIEDAIRSGLAKRGRKIETNKGVKECIVCGKPFQYIRKNALYCGEHCRKTLENRRRKERYTQFVNEICVQSLRH